MFVKRSIIAAALAPLVVIGTPIPQPGLNIGVNLNSIVAAVTSAVPAIAPVVSAVVQPLTTPLNVTAQVNLTLVATSTLKCANVAPILLGALYNFGCVCDSTPLSIQIGALQTLVTATLNAALPFPYPAGSTPTCDGSGGYTCPYGKNPDGSCAGSDPCTDAGTHYTNGMCCPVGLTAVDGVCCAQGNTVANGVCLPPILTCASGFKLLDTVCCALYQIQTTPGQCGCPTGYNDSGSACVPISTAPVCGSGYTLGKTICCPNGQSEITVGICSCPAGMKVLGLGCVSVCVGIQKLLGLCLNI